MSRFIARISVQLDYHPCTQFAGLHLALAKGLFAKRGLDVKLLPCSPVGGLEPELVANLQRTFDREDGGSKASVPHIAVGSVEQNVLVPAIARGVPCKAFATIFQKSVLALGALPGTQIKTAADLKGKTIAAHNDSQMELIQTLLSHGGVPATPAQVRQVLRANKMDLLLSGQADAVQVYGLMEGLEIESLLGKPPTVIDLEDLAATIPGGFTLPLGYSQVLFSTADALAAAPVREALSALMEVHEEGWKMCETDKEAAAEAVLEARAAAGINEDQDTKAWQIRSLEQTLPVVRGSASRIGVISSAVWSKASRAMAASGYAAAPVPLAHSLDTAIWPDAAAPAAAAASAGPARALEWDAHASAMAAEARARVQAFKQRAGRLPRVAIVRVGPADGEGGEEAAAACRAAGVAVKLVQVSGEGAGFDDAHAAIAELNLSADIDGIVLARPVGGGLDAAALGGCIARDKDVCGESVEAGAARAVQAELSAQRLFQPAIYTPDTASLLRAPLPLPPPWLIPGPAAPPCAAAAVEEVLERAGLSDTLSGASVLVIGSHATFGAPLSASLLRAGAVVTLFDPAGPSASASLPLLAAAAEQAHLVLAAPPVDLAPLGLGPRVQVPTVQAVGAALSLSILRLAEARNRRRDAQTRHKSQAVPGLEVEAPKRSWHGAAPGWDADTCGETGAELLRSVFVCEDFNGAMAFAGAVQGVCERANHHPTLHINPRRVCEQAGHGCEVVVELTTFVSLTISQADVELARRLSALAAALKLQVR